MQISNTPQNTNFQGRYWIKGDNNTVKELREKVVPLVHSLNPQKRIAVISVDDVFKETLSSVVDKAAELSGYGPAWILQNAKKHGVDVNLNDRNDIFIFSGNDLSEFAQITKKKKSLTASVGKIFSSAGIFLSSLGLPSHLRMLNTFNTQISKEERNVYKFAQNGCKKVNDIDELLFYLTKEK